MRSTSEQLDRMSGRINGHMSASIVASREETRRLFQEEHKKRETLLKTQEDRNKMIEEQLQLQQAEWQKGKSTLLREARAERERESAMRERALKSCMEEVEDFQKLSIRRLQVSEEQASLHLANEQSERLEEIRSEIQSNFVREAVISDNRFREYQEGLVLASERHRANVQYMGDCNANVYKVANELRQEIEQRSEEQAQQVKTAMEKISQERRLGGEKGAEDEFITKEHLQNALEQSARTHAREMKELQDKQANDLREALKGANLK